MKLTEQKLQQIIKEELDDLMGAPLSPEEKEKSDQSYEKKMRAKKMSDILLDLQAKGLTKEQIMLLIQQELDKT